MNTWKIYPIYMGTETMTASAVYYKANSHKEADVRVPCGAFVLKCDQTDETIMFDCGICDYEDYQTVKDSVNPQTIPPEAPSFKQGLARLKVDPKTVETCVISHLHMDHSFYMYLFENAEFYIQKAELQHAVTPTPAERGSYQFGKNPLLPCWHRVWTQIVPIEGDLELRDGIELWHLSSHTPGSQVAVVQTQEGPYILVGDIFYTTEQYEKKRMLGNFTDLEGWYRAHDKIKRYCEKNGGHVLMTHNAPTYEREVWG